MKKDSDKRFEYNDKWNRYLYWALFILTIVEVCGAVVSGFFMIFMYNVLCGVAVIMFGWIVPLIVYIVVRTLLGLCADVKYIRNKLYNEDNSEIESWWGEH